MSSTTKRTVSGPEPRQKRPSLVLARSRLSLPTILSFNNFFCSGVFSKSSSQDTVPRSSAHIATRPQPSSHLSNMSVATTATATTTTTTFSHPVLASKTPLDLPELLTLTFHFLARDNKLYPALLV